MAVENAANPAAPSTIAFGPPTNIQVNFDERHDHLLLMEMRAPVTEPAPTVFHISCFALYLKDWS